MPNNQDTLVDKLEDIGDAIRAKTGKSDKLTLSQMPTEIGSISGGGGVDLDELLNSNDVNRSSSYNKPITYNGTKIVQAAFQGFVNVPSFDLPRLTVISSNCFQYCFRESTIDYQINAPKAETVEANAFMGCTYLRNIALPKVTTIALSAFNNCMYLTSVYIPECSELASSAFAKVGSGITDPNDFCEIVSPKLGGFTNNTFNNARLKGLYSVITRSMQNTWFSNVSWSPTAKVILTSVKAIGGPAASSATFNNSTSPAGYLHTIDLGEVTTMGCLTKGYSELFNLVIRTESVCTLSLAPATAFGTDSPLVLGTGYVYVPDSLVDSYKAASNWSVIADQIKPLSEYVE